MHHRNEIFVGFVRVNKNQNLLLFDKILNKSIFKKALKFFLFLLSFELMIMFVLFFKFQK